jgi:phosphoribosyl-ATP pyrophosphohydrolase
MTDSLHRLFDAVVASKNKDPLASRTGRLLRASKQKIAKKLAEEAAEVAIEAVSGHRQDVIRESADLIYHLAVLWASMGIQPKDVWAEMDKRERLLGIAEKMPKNGLAGIAPGLVPDKAPVPIERARRRRVR